MGYDYNENGVGFATAKEQLAMVQVLALLLAHAPAETANATINWSISNISAQTHAPVLIGSVFRREGAPAAELEAIIDGWAAHLGVKVREMAAATPGRRILTVRAEIEDIDPKVIVLLTATLYNDVRPVTLQDRAGEDDWSGKHGGA